MHYGSLDLIDIQKIVDPTIEYTPTPTPWYMKPSSKLITEKNNKVSTNTKIEIIPCVLYGHNGIVGDKDKRI